MCRTSGIAGSVRLKIQDPMAAWDLDCAVAHRLEKHDIDHVKYLANQISVATWGEGESGGDVSGDPYADEATETW